MKRTFRDLYDSANPEQKLTILRMEMITPISKIRGYAVLMKQHHDAKGDQPAEIIDWINKIAEAAEYRKKLVDESG